MNFPISNPLSTNFNPMEVHDLFVLKSREIYHAEIRILDILALLHLVAKSDALKESIMIYYRSKGPQVERLQEVFLHLECLNEGKSNYLTTSILNFCTSLASEKKEVEDGEMGELLLELSHFFQSDYLWLVTMGRQLDLQTVTPLLEENLNEEWRVFERIKKSAGSASAFQKENSID